MALNASKLLVQAAGRKRDRVVELTSDLVKFNTTSPNPGEEPFDDKECQNFIAEHLKEIGFVVEVWEPDIETLSRYPFYIKGQNFKNRPILAAKLKGGGGGRSLILNAHVDVVPSGDPSLWKHKPWGGEVDGGRIFGRGSCDMKGGAAAIIATAEILNELGLQLQGDLIIETVLDEEINGMGTVACIEKGYSADAAIIPEPSNLDLWTATRGLLWAKTVIEGRSGHAELNHPDWSKGGAVNPIEKAFLVLDCFHKLEDDWSKREGKKHPLLSTPRIVPTIIRSGDFWATIPDRCEIEMDIQYLPADRDAKGYGNGVKSEIENRLSESCRGDGWLAKYPPKLEWIMDLPPMELEQNHPLIRTILSSAESLSFRPKISALDSWDDGAHLMSLANIPSVSIGPGPTEQAHVVNEFVSIDTLSRTIETLCLSVSDWCGTTNR